VSSIYHLSSDYHSLNTHALVACWYSLVPVSPRCATPLVRFTPPYPLQRACNPVFNIRPVMNVLTSTLPVGYKQHHILGNGKNVALCLTKFKKCIFVYYLIKYLCESLWYRDFDVFTISQYTSCRAVCHTAQPIPKYFSPVYLAVYIYRPICLWYQYIRARQIDPLITGPIWTHWMIFDNLAVDVMSLRDAVIE
jgi:hypothetical protein